MERLTYKRNNGYAINLPNALSEKDETLKWSISERENGMRLEGDIPNRLAAIEDILGDDYDIDHLRDLVQADREGRCIALPVKTGDNIYFTFLGKIIEKQVFSVVTFYNSQRIYCNGTSLYFRPDDIGETVFLTRKAAEEALKERENENGTKI